MYLNEVLGYIDFVKQKAKKESDTEYLSKSAKLKKSLGTLCCTGSIPATGSN
jgi:hypothetical protein